MSQPKTQHLNNQSAGNENLSDADENEESSLSKVKKQNLNEVKFGIRNGAENNSYNFSHPTAQLESLPHQIELFR